MTLNVLILCTHNSARSVLAEGMLNHWAQKLGKDVKAFSAGSAPSGRVNPFAIEVLQVAGVNTEGFRSKSWDEFTTPVMHVVITVCDSAAQEACPTGQARASRCTGAIRTRRIPRAAMTPSARPSS